MGFMLLVPSSSVITWFLILQLWTRYIIVNGALEENDSHEHTPFYDSHNHISEHDHFHEDGFCDCNSQGPWRPLFKPSQAELPAPESLHHIADSLHHTQNSDEQLQELSNELHPHSGERQAKKQNHMIHLHLIPHIYVPVVHPVTYSVYENEHKDQDHNLEHTTETSVSGENHYDQNHDQFYNQDHLQNQNYDSTAFDHSHESGEPLHNGYYYPHNSQEHQYQVHEDQNRDPFYGNFATGSNDNTHVLPINKNLNYNFFNTKKIADRSRYNKKFFEFPPNMLRLRVMRPPALGQKNTWLMNFADNGVFPSKTVFDFKPYPVKSPFVDFKQFVKPNLVHPLGKYVQTPVVPMNKFLPAPIVPVNKLLPAPVVVYPAEAKKRIDKVKGKN